MFTTASKFFLAVCVAALVATGVYFYSSDGNLLGVILLMSTAIVAGFLAGISFAWRQAIATRAITGRPVPYANTAPAEQNLVSPSLWPLIGGFGVALTAVGAALDQRVFIAGTVVLVAVVLEWVVQAWADRASDNADYNAELRSGILNPLEYPILGAISVGVIIVCFSRVMLALPKEGSLFVFLAVGTVVICGAFLLAYGPRLSSSASAGMLLLVGIGVITAGTAGAVIGARDFEQHDPYSAEARSTNSVGDKSNLLGSVVLNVDGALGPTSLIIPRATAGSLIFINEQTQLRNLVIVGKDNEGKEVVYAQSPYIGKDKRAFITVRIPNPGTYSFRSEGGSAPAEGTITVH